MIDCLIDSSDLSTYKISVRSITFDIKHDHNLHVLSAGQSWKELDLDIVKLSTLNYIYIQWQNLVIMARGIEMNTQNEIVGG